MDGLLWLEFERLSPPLSNRKYWRVYAAFHPYKAIFPERTHDAPPFGFLFFSARLSSSNRRCLAFITGFTRPQLQCSALG